MIIRRPLLKPREVADLFRVRTETVMRWIRVGKLRALRTPGGRDYRIPAAAIDALIAEHEMGLPDAVTTGQARAVNPPAA